jgi:leader peptidase (prepilin peptidase)/N-methyltransferase
MTDQCLPARAVYSTFPVITIRIFGTVLAALLGLAFGSFLNVCLSRWPEGESVVQPRSHCRNCGRTLAWWENIPVVSWIALRGRCRTCRAKISWRYPLVELAVGILWALAGWVSYKAFFPVEFAIGIMFFTFVLVGLAVLDAEFLWVPNVVTYPSIAIGLVWWYLQAAQVGWALHMPLEIREDATQIGMRFMAIIASAGLILLIRWTYWVIRRREGIGLGDAKLMAMLGAWLGLSGALLSFAIGVMIGAIFAVVVLAVPVGRRESDTWLAAKLPLGTFLCIGGIICALWGQPIISAYLHWAGF